MIRKYLKLEWPMIAGTVIGSVIAYYLFDGMEIGFLIKNWIVFNVTYALGYAFGAAKWNS